MDNAFLYIELQGLVTESEYAYTAKDGTCQVNKGPYKDTGYTDVNTPWLEHNNEFLFKACSEQPVSVAVSADDNWKSYTGGVLTKGGNRLNHGVVCVGFGTENGQQYWLVRNSWGTSWGEAGYVKISNKSGEDSGITLDASYPSC